MNKRRKKSFFQVAVTYVWPFTYIQNKMPIVGMQLLLNHALSFIDVTETRTLRSSSLNAHMLGTLLL